MIYRSGSGIWHVGRSGVATHAAASANWWLAGGAIGAGAVLEHVESPSVGQLYAGASVSAGNAWSIVARSDGYNRTSYPPSRYLLDSQTGRVILGFANNTEYGFYAGAWANVNIFADTNNHVWFLISDGSSVQAYLDGSAVGSAQSSSNGIGGTTRWKSANNNPANATWNNDVIGAVYSIALDATQRSALYAAMTA